MDWNPLAQLADAELPFQWPEGGIAARPFTGVEMTEERGKMIAVDA
jgi:hypothetical protein